MRPVIVIAEPVANTVLIIPCTSNIAAAQYASTVTLKPTNTNGLREISVALVFQLRAIDRKRLARRLGVLSSADYARIREAIAEILE